MKTTTPPKPEKMFKLCLDLIEHRKNHNQNEEPIVIQNREHLSLLFNDDFRACVNNDPTKAPKKTFHLLGIKFFVYADSKSFACKYCGENKYRYIIVGEVCKSCYNSKIYSKSPLNELF